MAINVTCPGCHKRFTVSDKFAGQKGPCPSCKTVIQIPAKSDEVVVHAPEQFGPKDSAGRAVLKPIFRQETRFSVVTAVAIGVSIITVLVVALLLRSYEGQVPTWILGLGAVLLGPPLAYAGYSFLRDDELEPFPRNALLLRSLICGLLYAGIWGLYAAGVQFFNDGEPLEIFQLAFASVAMALLGAGAAFVSYDFEFGTGIIHYALYLVVTVLLRLIMGMTAY